jgi:hypothetical protein
MKKEIDYLTPQEIYDQNGNDPFSWLRTADSLLDSANIIMKEIGEPKKSETKPEIIWGWIRIHYVARMLRGMAFECLLKGIWVKVGHDLTKNGKYKKIPNTKNHNLLSIYNTLKTRFEIELTPEEEDLLSRFSFSIISARYPIRKSAQGACPTKPNNNKKIYWNKITHESDEITYNSMIKKMKSIIMK